MSRPDNSSAQNAWSRRRAAVLAEADEEHAQAQAVERAELQAEQASKSDAQILAELDLKDPDQLQAGDDFAAFLRDEVPAHLQRRALRILWRSNPVLACVDNLVDYGNDFRAEALGAGVVQTSYRVGKGMLAHVKEMQKQEMQKQAAKDDPAASASPQVDAEAEAEAEAGADTETGTAVAPKNDDERPVASDQGLAQVTADTVPAPEPEPEQAQDQPIYPHKRRMRFEFGGVA